MITTMIMIIDDDDEEKRGKEEEEQKKKKKMMMMKKNRKNKKEAVGTGRGRLGGGEGTGKRRPLRRDQGCKVTLMTQSPAAASGDI